MQDNHARSADCGVVRGLHLQIAPSAQGKLIRVVRGAIWDVAADNRRNSPTYLRHAGVVLASCWRRRTGSSSGVPADYSRLLHARARHRGVIYKGHRAVGPPGGTRRDLERPALAIPRPIAPAAAILSDKDRVRSLTSDGWFAGRRRCDLGRIPG